MNNKVFYQHPNLMRVLGMHETVMEVMVNVLGTEKSQVRLQEFGQNSTLGPGICKVAYSEAAGVHCLSYSSWTEGGTCTMLGRTPETS